MTLTRTLSDLFHPSFSSSLSSSSSSSCSSSCSSHCPTSSVSSLALLSALPASLSTSALVSTAHLSRRVFKYIQLRGPHLLFFSRPPPPSSSSSSLCTATHIITLRPHNVAYSLSATLVCLTGVSFRFSFSSSASAHIFVSSLTSAFSTPTFSSPPPSSSSTSIKSISISKHDAFFTPTDLRAVVAHRLVLERLTLPSHHSNYPSPFVPVLRRAFQTPEDLHLLVHATGQLSLQHALHSMSKGSQKPSNKRTLPKVSESVVRLLFAELVCALADVHDLGIVHRNLTLDSVLLTTAGHVQLSAFHHAKLLSAPAGDDSVNDNNNDNEDDDGSSSVSSGSECDKEDNALNAKGKEDEKLGRTFSFVGPRSYMAPEMFSSSSSSSSSSCLSTSNSSSSERKDPNGYTTSVDVWSLGIILHTLLTGKHPFTSLSPSSSRNIRDRQNRTLSSPSSLSPDARALLNGLLHRDSKERLTLEQVRNSPWLRDIEWSSVREAATAGTSVEAVVDKFNLNAVQNVSSQNQRWVESEGTVSEEEEEEREEGRSECGSECASVSSCSSSNTASGVRYSWMSMRNKMKSKYPWRRYRVKRNRDAIAHKKATVMTTDVDLVGFAFDMECR